MILMGPSTSRYCWVVWTLLYKWSMAGTCQNQHMDLSPWTCDIQRFEYLIASPQAYVPYFLDHALNIFEVLPSQSFWVGQPLLSRCRSSVRAALDLQLCTWAQWNPCCRDACRHFVTNFWASWHWPPKSCGLALRILQSHHYIYLLFFHW